MRRVLVLLILPLVLLGGGLVRGKCLLPLALDACEPLASEVTRADDAQIDYLASDRIFPLLTDELAIREQFAAGVLPTWQPLQGVGAPLAAGTLAGVWYPPNALKWLCGPLAAQPWLALLSLFLAGLGLWLYLERRELAFGACAVGALAYQAGGWACANIHLAMKLDAALWLPWSLWALEGLLAGRRHAGFALAASTTLALLAGFPGVALLSLAACALYALVRCVEEHATARVLPRAALFLALGVGGAALQLVPTWEASANSLRHPQSLAELAPQALPLASLLTLVTPNLFGLPSSPIFASRDPLTWLATASFETPKALGANALEWNLFAGVAVVALATAGAVLAFRRARATLIVAAFALAFALGLPLAEQLYRVPGLDLGTPARAACVLWACLPILAAFGVQALLDARPHALLVPASVALFLGAAAVWVQSAVDVELWTRSAPEWIAARHGLDAASVRAELADGASRLAAQRVRLAAVDVLSAALATLGALLVAGRLDPEKRSPLRWLAFAAVIGLESTLASLPHVVWREGGARFPASPAMSALAATAGDGRVLRLDESAEGTTDVLALARPNLPEAYGIGDLTPYIVFTPRWTVELLCALDPHARYRSGASRLSDARLLDSPVLDLLRVTALLSRDPVQHERLELVLSRPEFQIQHRSGSFAAARVVAAAQRCASDEQVLERIRAGEVDLARTCLLAPDAAPPPAATARETFEPGALAVTRPAPDRFEVSVRGSSGGWLVMHEAWYPGWRASVDGAATPLVRADHACRAVQIPAGDCVVRTWYAPNSLRWGALLSVVSLLGAAFLSRGARAAK